MTKVLYNGEYIELNDELEPGYMELDMLTEQKDEIEDIIEVKNINLEDTQEFKFKELEDTQEFDLGDIDGK